MHESTIAKRYANALAALAAEQGILEQVGEELVRFKDVLDQTPTMRLLLVSPTASPRNQHAILDAYLEQSTVSGITANCLRLLVDKGRMPLVNDLVAAYQRETERRSGRLRVAVRAAVPLEAEQQARLNAVLDALTSKQVTLEVTAEPSLLGGLVVRIGSTMMDYSVRNRLNHLKVQMKG